MNDHHRIDERSRAFGHAIAARLSEHPELINDARATLARWLTTCSPRSQSTLMEWMTALDGPTDGVIALLTEVNERAVRLRQSNPFAGLLSNRERNAILQAFQSHDASST